MLRLVFASVFLIYCKQVTGGSDYEVEQVKSPYVESKDVGTKMTSSMDSRYQIPNGFYGQNGFRHGCLTCQYNSGEILNTGINPQKPFHYPSSYQSTSSKHELKKEKEYLGGQQVYDLHHEKEYKYGALINEEHREKTAEDFGIYPPERSQENRHYSSFHNNDASSEINSQPSSHSYSSSQSNYGSYSSPSGATMSASRPNSFSSSRVSGNKYGTNIPDDNADMSNEFERLRKELEHRTQSLHQSSNIPTYQGGTHRTEVRTQRKYINGKPVYIRNEEKKYRDGKLVHNVTEEQGSKKLGASSYPLYSSNSRLYPNGQQQHSNSHSSNYFSSKDSSENIAQSPMYPYRSYNSANRSYSADSFMTDSKYRPYHQKLLNTPGQMLSSETREENQEKRTYAQYYPDYQKVPYGTNTDQYYDSSSEYRNPIRVPYQTSTISPKFENRYRAYNSISNKTMESRVMPPSNTYIPYSQSTYQHSTQSQHTPLKTNYQPFSYGGQNIEYREEAYNRGTNTTSSIPSHATKDFSHYPYSQQLYHNPRQYSEQSSSTNRYHKISDNKAYYPSEYKYPHSYTSVEEELEDTYKPLKSETLTQTMRSFQPSSHSTTVTRKKENAQKIESHYNPSTHKIFTSSDTDSSREPTMDSSREPTDQERDTLRIPGVISGPSTEDQPDDDEQERYDISPLVDGGENEEITTDHYSESNREQYKRLNISANYPNYFENSRYGSGERLYYGTNRRLVPQSNLPLQYSSTNTSSQTDHRTTTIIPPKWIETKTTWKYTNGRLTSLINYSKFYENGILIHENSTVKTRNQLAKEGIDVNKMDLTFNELALYGPSITTRTDSQIHEVHQIKKFANGQQIYELTQERFFQNGELVDEKKEEKDEDDFGVMPIQNYHSTQTQQFGQQSVLGGYGPSTHNTDSHQTLGLPVNPRSYARRHEVRQQEEFINGQKMYDLYHEKEYQNGKLIKENKTELGPNQLRNRNSTHSDAHGNILTTGGQRINQHHGQQTENILTTQCLTCGSHLFSNRSAYSGNVLGSNNYPAGGSTYKHDYNIEEKYENGKLVKGREERNKWQDGRLVDSDIEHYERGPSRISTDFSDSSYHHQTMSSREDMLDDIDHCNYNPCLNGGNCRVNGRMSICVCSFGFRGSTCQEAYCPRRYCRYGGNCSISNGSHMCSCRTGYTGQRCMTRVHKLRVGVNG